MEEDPPKKARCLIVDTLVFMFLKKDPKVKKIFIRRNRDKKSP